MKVNPSAECISCDDRLGRPYDVVEEDGEDFTLYKCIVCESSWLRPHTP